MFQSRTSSMGQCQTKHISMPSVKAAVRPSPSSAASHRQVKRRMQTDAKDTAEVVECEVKVLPVICEAQPGYSNDLDYYTQILDSPLYVFLSGMYDSKSNRKPHPFFSLPYDVIRRIAEFGKNWRTFPYTGDPEESGIIRWISGIEKGEKNRNPIYSGHVVIENRRDYHVNYSRNEGAVARVLQYPPLNDKDCYFDPGIVVLHFPHFLIHPSGYSLRNGGGRGSVVRKWKLEGSRSLEGPWTLLSNHANDDTFFNDVSQDQAKENSFLAHAWPITVAQQTDSFFSYFRLSSLHSHTSGRPHALYVSGFELYGVLKINSRSLDSTPLPPVADVPAAIATGAPKSPMGARNLELLPASHEVTAAETMWSL